MDEAAGALKGLQEEAFPTPGPKPRHCPSRLTKQRSVRELEERNTQVQDSLATASKALESLRHDRHGLGVSSRRRKGGCARLRGLQSQDVNLLRWVLAQQLDQVAEVASEHLRQMTNGRYTIRRAGDKKGGGKKGP